MSRRWIALGLATAAFWCARAVPASDVQDDDLPAFSADRLGDADAPEPAPEEEHYLSPAEREALAAQGYELEIDDTIVTQTRIQEPRRARGDDEPKGAFGRAMDKVGKGMVAVASVVVPLAAAVAPFFLF